MIRMKTSCSVIGLIGALDEEIEQLVSRLQNHQTEKRAGTVFHIGSLESFQVVLCKSGVGKVNAAICTQLLIDHYDADAIWFTGVAGALDPRLTIGDIVISTECMQHDVDASALGFPRGVIPYESHSLFAADQTLIEAAVKAGKSLETNVYKGRILSGDQFIADEEVVRSLHEQFNGMCTEMEGAAVAQVCHKNEIPFVIIRSISDRADGSADVNFTEFVRLAAAQSCAMILSMMEVLKQS